MKETRKYFLVVSLGVLISSTVWSLCGLCLIGTNRVALFGKLLIDSCQKLKRHPDIHGSIHIYERLRVTKKSSSMDPALLQSVLKLQFPEYSIHMWLMIRHSQRHWFWQSATRRSRWYWLLFRYGIRPQLRVTIGRFVRVAWMLLNVKDGLWREWHCRWTWQKGCSSIPVHGRRHNWRERWCSSIPVRCRRRMGRKWWKILILCFLLSPHFFRLFRFLNGA